MKETEPVVDFYYTDMSNLPMWNSSECPVKFMEKEEEALWKHDYLSLIWGGHVKIQADLSSFTLKSIREALLFR